MVHSSFHKDVPQARYDIVIDPKMAFVFVYFPPPLLLFSFLVSEALQFPIFIVLGSGTGILAMLASMRGAAPVTGIEIDPDAWANAVENARINGLDIRMICGDASALRELEPADYLLANINRNIILGDIAVYARALKPGGVMLLSGFYDHDLPMIEAAAVEEGLEYVDKKLSADWCAAKFRKRTL